MLLFAIFVGIPVLMCLTKRFNICDCLTESRKRKNKYSYKSESEVESISDDETDDLMNDDDSLDESLDKKGNITRRNLVKRLKRLKRQSNVGEHRRNDRKRREQAAEIVGSSDTIPLSSLETNEMIPSTPMATTTSTILPTTTPIEPTSTTIPMTTTTPTASNHLQSDGKMINDNNQSSSDYAYIVYRPDSNYVAVSRSLKNLIPSNTTVIYKVDETSNHAEAGSIINNMKQTFDGFDGKIGSIPLSSDLILNDGSPSALSRRSLRSNYFVLNSNLLLKQNGIDTKINNDINQTKTKETVFVYSTKTKLPNRSLSIVEKQQQQQQQQSIRHLKTMVEPRLQPNELGSSPSFEDNERSKKTNRRKMEKNNKKKKRKKDYDRKKRKR
ncbi:hypothetical protein RDWZM_006860 [Blomia tropicalis]|uniref:Uncharacterized protein n=1 Tax=Blomia tropicalis TaxID=40697 RepID=A0A9Q0RM57_BLOTA|nr:hypothetical protein RDWZM_006860 [Blomia tropicalis]